LMIIICYEEQKNHDELKMDRMSKH
jgi:hypothetical protein